MRTNDYPIKIITMVYFPLLAVFLPQKHIIAGTKVVRAAAEEVNVGLRLVPFERGKALPSERLSDVA